MASDNLCIRLLAAVLDSFVSNIVPKLGTVSPRSILPMEDLRLGLDLTFKLLFEGLGFIVDIALVY